MATEQGIAALIGKEAANKLASMSLEVVDASTMTMLRDGNKMLHQMLDNKVIMYAVLGAVFDWNDSLEHDNAALSRVLSEHACCLDDEETPDAD